MEIKIVLFITLLLYTIIVSQSWSYIISLRNVQQHLEAPAYIAFRQLTDKNFNAKFRYVIYASLLANLVLLILCGIQFSGLLFTGAVISFTALLTDTFIAVKGNVPINKIINTWTPEQYPSNWAGYRNTWLRIFSIRQALNITGFISLLATAIFSI